MSNFKYRIGEKLYPAGCSKGYKLANPFVVGKRKTEEIRQEIDGETLVFKRQLYSPSPDEFSQVWFGCEHLTKNIESGAY